MGKLSTVQLIFETHQLTDNNEAGIATGWLPGHLSEKGRQLAKELGQRRAVDAISAVFTSDLYRAVETAHIAFGGTGIPIYRDSRLRECNYGLLNGKPVATLQGRRIDHITEPFPGGESYIEVVDRVKDFLKDLAAQWQGKTVLVIGHSATRWALDHLINGARLEDLVDAPFQWKKGWEYVVTSKLRF